MFRYLLVVVLFSLLFGCSSVRNPPTYEHNPQVDILRDGYHKKLLIEVITLGCQKPDPDALDYLKQKIEKHCNKTQVVVFHDDPIPLVVAPTLLWDANSLSLLEKNVSRFRTTGDTLVIKVLYVAGLYSEGITTRGVAYADYAFAVFRNNFGPAHERAVLLHEFGHLIGLVNCGTPAVSDHAETDPKHKPHCRNENLKCVMYWCSPTIPNPDFDLACKQDIVANGGK